MLDKGQILDSDAYIEKCLRPLVDDLWKERPKTGCHVLKQCSTSQQSNCFKLPKRAADRSDAPPTLFTQDLAPCDYWLFGLIKRGLTDQKDDNTLFKSVFFVQNSISEKEYKKTFSKLVKRYKLCIKKKGEYFEHSNEKI